MQNLSIIKSSLGKSVLNQAIKRQIAMRNILKNKNNEN